VENNSNSSKLYEAFGKVAERKSLRQATSSSAKISFKTMNPSMLRRNFGKEPVEMSSEKARFEELFVQMQTKGGNRSEKSFSEAEIHEMRGCEAVKGARGSFGSMMTIPVQLRNEEDSSGVAASNLVKLNFNGK